jgi:hypothetical protein
VIVPRVVEAKAAYEGGMEGPGGCNECLASFRQFRYPTDLMKNESLQPASLKGIDVTNSVLSASTAAEISRDVQNQAATLLGKIMFAFGELERDLALCLVWVRDGRELEALTKQYEESSFSDKLERLEKFVKSDVAANSKQCAAYSEWLVKVDAVRLIRNELAHGRWWFDPHNNCAVNISGIPTSSKQKQNSYTVDGLAKFLETEVRHQFPENRIFHAS